MYNIDFEWNHDRLYLKLERIEKELQAKIEEYKGNAQAGKYERNHFLRWEYYIQAMVRVHQEQSEIRQKYCDKVKREVYKTVMPNKEDTFTIKEINK